MKTFLNQKQYRSIVFASLSMSAILFSCKSGTQENSSVNLIETSNQGQTITANEAKPLVEQYCGKNLVQWATKMSHVRFQAGYLDHFGNTGYAYDLVQKRNEFADREGLFRSNQGNMYSMTNVGGVQMGMEPPSTQFDHIDLFNAECSVALKSFEGSNNWEKIEWKNGMSMGGQLAGGEVSIQENCLQGTIKSLDFGTVHSLAFCPHALITDTTTSSGAASRAQVVIY